MFPYVYLEPHLWLHAWGQGHQSAPQWNIKVHPSGIVFANAIILVNLFKYDFNVLSLLDNCQIGIRGKVHANSLKLSYKFLSKLPPRGNRPGWKFFKPLLKALCESYDGTLTSRKAGHLSKIYIVVERIKMIFWICKTLIGRNGWHLEIIKKWRIDNFIREWGEALISFLLFNKILHISSHSL